ncbi:DNA-binding transcriptional regulator, MocR family, contains an aminotransferase domain [Andreprevotia lacus DSM 23236]|jgi:DNA-binding transcriptional MocR family regulator|uniref:Putative 8-amino-7-oxononanoate synthase n=1 Tax=Andreprevotia lacus DSM 23236 TaxID=1121001 RepID=A0A1W1XJW7_9NEIS|nr:PLP-dependent aminotransferase family protein [Andreprevotia lacus]SMC23841.1 DNA-binding transcriptional regulator, MocR family, contains an aminotransferase domain [Andreprevotia lacus DSM 23236]
MTDFSHPRRKADTLYFQLAEELAQAIASGLLKRGEKLPSIRKLSTQRQVSLSTVMEAYRELEDRGVIEARPQSGFYVCEAASAFVCPALTQPPSVPRNVVTPAELWPYHAHDLHKIKVDFGFAVLSPEVFPTQPLQRLLAQTTRYQPRMLADYGKPAGDLELRRHIARRALAWGGHFEAEDVLITNGCIEALNLCLRAVTQPGDVVAIESPTYFGLLQILESFQLKALEIPTHPQTGISIEALELATRNGEVKACLLIPNFSNPLGSLMPDENKKRLVELLASRNIPLIEDDIYGEFYRSGNRPRPAKAFDTTDNVMLCSSFTKVLAPGMRIGWVAGGRWRREIEKLKFINTYSTPLAFQQTIARFLENGGYDHHLRRLRRIVAEQVDGAVAAIRRYFPADTRLNVPQGGFALWIELPEAINTRELLNLAMPEGISFAYGELFSPSHSYQNCMRICAVEPWTTRHERAIQRLGELCQQLLAQRAADGAASVLPAGEAA